MVTKKFIVKLVLFSSFFSFAFLQPTRNVSRYFTFLENPEDYYATDGFVVSPSAFFATASTAFKRDGGTLSLSELHGSYDLKDVIASAKAVKAAAGEASYNPFSEYPSYVSWDTKSIKLLSAGKVTGCGLTLGLNKRLFKSNFSAGCFVPFMRVSSTTRFSVKLDGVDVDGEIRDASQQEVDMIDSVRRRVHRNIGLLGEDWSKVGLGDIDLFVAHKAFWDHRMRTKAVRVFSRLGCLIPLGEKIDSRYPSSVPFMGNGHWAFYFDVFPELELRQNWRLGFMSGLVWQLPKTSVSRISYGNEPANFSAISGNVGVNPGFTLKFAPYFMLENLIDGLTVQARMCFLRHWGDTLKDKRSDKTVRTYLSAEDMGGLDLIEDRKNLTKWMANYLSFHFLYDSKEAMKNWWLNPKFRLTYDHPFWGRKRSKMHQLTVGVEVAF
jgi:hypothetical protein